MGKDALKSERRTVLVVDDDESQRLLIQRAFASLDLKCHVETLCSGNEAIAHLGRLGKLEDRERRLPDYIITDLNMDNGDGLVLLEFLKKNPALSAIPVVVLSSSENPDDIQRCFVLGCSAYFVKPATQTQLQHLLHKIDRRMEKRMPLRQAKASGPTPFTHRGQFARSMPSTGKQRHA